MQAIQSGDAPAGSVLVRQKPGRWWLYFNAAANRTYLVQALGFGRTRTTPYAGRVEPACCRGH